MRFKTPLSFTAQGIFSDLVAATLYVAYCGHETPCTSKPSRDFLVRYFGSRVKIDGLPFDNVDVRLDVDHTANAQISVHPLWSHTDIAK